MTAYLVVYAVYVPNYRLDGRLKYLSTYLDNLPGCPTESVYPFTGCLKYLFAYPDCLWLST